MSSSQVHVVVVGRIGPVTSVFVNGPTCLDDARALAKLTARTAHITIFPPSGRDAGFAWRLERGQR